MVILLVLQMFSPQTLSVANCTACLGNISLLRKIQIGLSPNDWHCKYVFSSQWVYSQYIYVCKFTSTVALNIPKKIVHMYEASAIQNILYILLVFVSDRIIDFEYSSQNLYSSTKQRRHSLVYEE